MRLVRCMNKRIVHSEGADAGHQTKTRHAALKLGVGVHLLCYVVAAQHGHAAVKLPRRFASKELERVEQGTETRD